MKTLQHAFLAFGALAIFSGSPASTPDAAGFIQRWLLNRGRMNYPLHWDRLRQGKPAFQAVVDILKGGK